jgi:hypothetical protein
MSKIKDCGCVPGQYMCYKHRRQEEAQAYKRLTEAEKAYDRYVDPLCAYHTDFPYGCSCHKSAPCSYCMRQED